MKRIARCLHRVAIAALCCCIFGQPLVAWSDGPRGNVRSLRSTLMGELHPRHLTVFGLRVGNDRLGAMPVHLGRAATFSPDSAPQLLSTCFVDSQDGSLSVMFQAQRYDPSQRVRMAYIGPASALDPGRRCRPTAGLAQAAATASGIYIGMPRAAFAAQFEHPPSESRAGVLGYYFYQPAAGDCQLLSGARARFENDELVALTLYRLYRGRQC
jgi:hypothetical protein